jgi:hypothetical protein
MILTAGTPRFAIKTFWIVLFIPDNAPFSVGRRKLPDGVELFAENACFVKKLFPKAKKKPRRGHGACVGSLQ